jgi:hypothetical protein
MAAHKKGQAHPGPYTDAKNEHTESSRHTQTSVNGGVEMTSSPEAKPLVDPVSNRKIEPVTGGPGLADILPK